VCVSSHLTTLPPPGTPTQNGRSSLSSASAGHPHLGGGRAPTRPSERFSRADQVPTAEYGHTASGRAERKGGPPRHLRESTRDELAVPRPTTSLLGEPGVRLRALERFVLPRTSARTSAVIMAFGTTFSRLSGFARLVAIGWVLGQGRLADAFNQANTIPNTVYDLLLGGVLSATLLPVVIRPLTRVSTGQRDDSVSAITTFLAVVLVVATGIFWLVAPWVVDLFLVRAHGAGAAAERSLASTWLRYFAPQLFFIGLVALTTALLNARRRFAAVAFSPIVANLVAIVALVVADHMVRVASVNVYKANAAAVAVVGVGTTAGYAAQLLAQLPALIRARVPIWFSWRPRHPALRSIARLSAWTAGAVVANQLSFSLVSILANSKPGNLSSFLYSYTFMQLPYAIFAVSISYVVAPDLAQLWARGDREGFASKTGYAFRVTVALLLPAGVGYALVARPVVVLALAHGHLGVASADLTGGVLEIFASGLPGFSAFLLLMRVLQAKLDTRSMFWLYFVENLLTIVSAVTVYPFYGVRGLAVAWIGAYTLVLPLAWLRLRQDVPVRLHMSSLGRIALATALMGIAVGGVQLLYPSGGTDSLLVGRLAVEVSVGAVMFIMAARALGVPELAVLSFPRRSSRSGL
jgi:putative peptidoglycan lipid II flippase